MSVQEPKTRWVTEHPSKPAAEMTSAEWEAHKQTVRRLREAEGLPDLEWELIGKPQPVSEATKARVRGMALPDD